MTRIPTLLQSKITLANLQRQVQGLNDTSQQLSSGLKAPIFRGIASDSNQYLNVSALQSRSEGYLQTITRTNTRLGLMDQNLDALQKLARDFQSNLAQQSSSPTPPNVAQLARAALASANSFLNATDGSGALFAGSRFTDRAVANLVQTPFASKTAQLGGNLPATGTSNTQVHPPTPGSFLDVAIDQSEAVYDANGVAHKLSLRFVKVRADDTSTAADELLYDAYLTGVTRIDNGLSSTNPPITVTAPVKLSSQPFNPRDLSTIPSQASQPSAASTASVGTTPSQPSAASLQSVASGVLSFQLGRGSIPPLAVGTANGLFVQIRAETLLASPPGTASYQVSGAASALTAANNATASQTIRIDGNLSSQAPAGTTADVTFDGPNALYDSLNNPHRIVVRYTKVEANVPDQPGNPTSNPPVPFVPGQTRNVWRADIVSMTNTITGFPTTDPPIDVNNSATWVQISDRLNLTADMPPSLGTLTIPAGPVTSLRDGTVNGAAANTAATMTVDLRPGNLVTTQVSAGLTAAYAQPVEAAFGTFTGPPGLSVPSIVRLGMNLNLNDPINSSIANPTAGSFVDVTFRNAEALVDSAGNRHDVTLRIVRNANPPGVPVGNTLPFNVYIIGMKQAADGSDSTQPAITAEAPQLIASFDPTSTTTARSVNPATGLLEVDVGSLGTVRPALKNGASINVRLPFVTSGGGATATLTDDTLATFTTTTGSMTISRAENVTPPPTKTTPTNALLVAGTLSSAATPALVDGNFDLTTGVFTAGTAPPNNSDHRRYRYTNVTSENTVDVRYTGQSALVDSRGKAFNATVRFQYQISNLTNGIPAWVATLTDLTDPETGASLGITPVRLSQTNNVLTQGFNPTDALRGPLSLGPISVATQSGGAINLSMPVNSSTFKTSGTTALVPGGDAPSALTANVVDTSYFLTANPNATDTTNDPLTVRVADDLVLRYGLRADDLSFENLIRVLNFMQSQSVPPSQTDLVAAQTLLTNAINGIQGLRSQIASNQITLKNQEDFQKTTVRLATDTRANILSADPDKTAVRLTSLQTTLEASYATLSNIRSLNLASFLR
jgi:flagellin-like hook-associated protein FlgL